MTAKNQKSGAANKRTRKPQKQQRVDRLTDLRLDDPTIDRDARLFEIIKEAYKRNRLDKRHRAGLKTPQSLYSNYRGNGFPLQQRNGKKLPAWRTLSPWMKVQLASLVLAEHGYMQFVIHVHGELQAELVSLGKDQRVYLRDRISRALRTQFGETRWFFFVMEDRDPDDELVRAHAHGSIEVRREPLPAKGQPHYLLFQRLAKKQNEANAERTLGLLRVRKALRAASGNLTQRRPRIVAGVHQHRNVSVTAPTRPFTNEGWVTYSFKNVKKVSSDLGENRVAFPHGLRSEARRLWELIRQGERAINQWP